MQKETIVNVKTFEPTNIEEFLIATEEWSDIVLFDKYGKTRYVYSRSERFDERNSSAFQGEFEYILLNK